MVERDEQLAPDAPGERHRPGVRRKDLRAERDGDVDATVTGAGHPGAQVPHLHFGVRLDGAYQDPLWYLAPLGVQDLIRLVPLVA